MDCRLIAERGELVAFVFGTSSEEERARVDAHLLTCTDCLKAYLRFKHHVERGASLLTRPSDDVKRRIRDDVAALVRPRGAARVRAWLRRPIPLYQGLAAALVLAGIVVMSPWVRDVMSSRRPVVAESRVDSARPIAQSLAIY